MSTGTSGGYWDAKALPSVLKHTLLKTYIPKFGGKTGSVSRRVVYLDGYAGEGRYESGEQGSPEILMRIAGDHAMSDRLPDWTCFFVERERESATRLEAVAAEYRARGVDARVHRGDVEQLMDAVIAEAAGLPLFLFLDPCGLGLSFERLAEVLTGPRAGRWPPTEFMLNFSMDAVRRIGGHARSLKGNQASQRRLDAVCGGGWWRTILGPEFHPEADEEVAAEYARRLGVETHMSVPTVSVARAPRQRAVYHLVFGTRSAQGLWFFGDAAARARDAWWRTLDLNDDPELSGTLFSLSTVLRPDPKDVRDQALSAITANIGTLLARGQRVPVVDHTLEIYGDFYGQVTETVVREAVKRLHALGKTPSTGVGGKPHELVVAPPA